MPQTTHRRRQPFFRDPSTHDLIERIADAQALTIFVGAGVSLDRGSLTWDDLVVRLLADRLSRRPGAGPEKARRAGARALASSLGPVAAASAVRELYQRDRPNVKETALMEVIANDVHKRLYPAQHWSPGGALAEAVVRLAVMWKALGRDVAILTTNYDNNLEDFAGDTGAQTLAKKRRISIRPFVDRGRVGSKTIPVYHLNGFIPHVGQPRGNFAFSETGLALGGEVLGTRGPRLDWRTRIIEERLKSSTAVFVGTSLRDPTVVNGLIATADAAAACPRYGAFAYQGDTWCDDPRMLRREANEALAARLEHLRVEPVRPDYYGQVAQLLNEVVHCAVTCRGKYIAPQRYGDRLDGWWKAWSQRIHYGKEANEVQDTCQQVLEAAKRELASTLVPHPRDELLKIELWIRSGSSDQRQLELWGTSTDSSRSVRENVRTKIQNESAFPAVRAFCQGYDYRAALDVPGLRWKSHFSVPVVLRTAPWHRVPVGVITVLSSKPEESSCLRHLNDPLPWAGARDVLTAAGQKLLDPESAIWP